ncbi:MAG: tRNA-binding protein [Candidatus Micrarchaeaceae archaeon]
MPSIDEFGSFGLRVGRIVEIDDLDSGRKPMYKLRVDLGELGTRTLVAGLRDHYKKEELLNTLIVVVTNLEPKMVANTLSEGMLLAADDGTNVSVLRPDRELPPGSVIR